MDATLLKPEATSADVAALVADAVEFGTYSVCVSPSMLPVEIPEGSDVKVAVVTGFPSGKHLSQVKALEAEFAVARGAHEIDMVIDVAAAVEHRFDDIEADVAAVRAAAPAPTIAGFMGPAHLNPAVTLGMAMIGNLEWAMVIPFILAQTAGAIVGAVLVWLTYLAHFRETTDQGAILGTFATAPEIYDTVSNVMSEAIGTFVLVFGIMAFGQNSFTDGLNPLVVGVLILSIGLSLGGSTGYAINPARDLGPRIAHAFLPLKNKGGQKMGIFLDSSSRSNVRCCSCRIALHGNSLSL